MCLRSIESLCLVYTTAKILEMDSGFQACSVLANEIMRGNCIRNFISLVTELHECVVVLKPAHQTLIDLEVFNCAGDSISNIIGVHSE